MDESDTIKNFSINSKTNKIKFIKTLEMTSDDKANFEAKEFENISITDKVLY